MNWFAKPFEKQPMSDGKWVSLLKSMSAFREIIFNSKADVMFQKFRKYVLYTYSMQLASMHVYINYFIIMYLNDNTNADS